MLLLLLLPPLLLLLRSSAFPAGGGGRPPSFKGSQGPPARSPSLSPSPQLFYAAGRPGPRSASAEGGTPPRGRAALSTPPCRQRGGGEPAPGVRLVGEPRRGLKRREGARGLRGGRKRERAETRGRVRGSGRLLRGRGKSGLKEGGRPEGKEGGDRYGRGPLGGGERGSFEGLEDGAGSALLNPRSAASQQEPRREFPGSEGGFPRWRRPPRPGRSSPLTPLQRPRRWSGRRMRRRGSGRAGAASRPPPRPDPHPGAAAGSLPRLCPRKR